MPEPELTAEERRLEGATRLFAFVFAALAIGYVLQGALAGAEFPFVVNSAAKDGLMAALCLKVAGDSRRNAWALMSVVAAHVLLITALLLMLAFGNIDDVSGSFKAPFGLEVPAPELLFWAWIALAASMTATMIWLHSTAQRARYGLRYLRPHQHRTAMALSEVLVTGPDEPITPEQVAKNIDDYLVSFRARKKGVARIAYTALSIYPMLLLHPPFQFMSPQRRKRFIEHRFIRDVAERRLPGFLRRPVQSMLYAAQQFAFIGYYADPLVAETCGYVPFTRRARFAALDTSPDPERRPLEVVTPNELDAERITADAVVIGSGAAGALLAHRLAARGREVVVLERGLHLDPSEFTESEGDQFSKLYADGALQMSTDARFQVLQGMCVGGTTVVNNAVCFDLPEPVLRRWNDPDGLDARLDPERLAQSFASVRSWLPVSSQGSNPNLGAGGRKLGHGIRELGLDQPPSEYDVVEANLSDCLGCGYCNIGCPYGRKLSALDVTLPRAQAEFGPEAVRILSECTAERIATSDGRARLVHCRLSDGRELRIDAGTVVVAAGAIASSLLLQRSGLGGEIAGTTLGFNLGAPMTGQFEEKLDAYDGLQISHYLRPPDDDGVVIEAWFNPIGAQALFMPGWFSDHFENMRNYDRMACAGSVVGTRRNARVRPGFRGRGMKLDYVPADDDLRRLVDGLKLIGRIYLAAGATKVMPTTFMYMPITGEAGLERLDEVIVDNTDIQLHSSHPQGGNPISPDPAKGVVDERFRVHGFENLYLCDASVFPSPITVNPQLTVMALAEYAAPGID